MRGSEIPHTLGPEFSAVTARELGLSRSRLRANDLEVPFRATRIRRNTELNPPASEAEQFERLNTREMALIRALSTRLVEGQFFTHRSAALIWGAPVPPRATPDLHLGVLLPQRAPRVQNVQGHSFLRESVLVSEVNGLPAASPASVFAMMGALRLFDLVALGDYFIRVYRSGHRRPDAGREPLATAAQLREAVEGKRWSGVGKLRLALDLVREDAWSPRESFTRALLVTSGLPEPELNVDLFASDGSFLACVDMVYPRYKVIVEYQGRQHAQTYEQDIERIERLQAEGWAVIQITNTLARRPGVLVSRVASRLRERGWGGTAT